MIVILHKKFKIEMRTFNDEFGSEALLNSFKKIKTDNIKKAGVEFNSREISSRGSSRSRKYKLSRAECSRVVCGVAVCAPTSAYSQTFDISCSCQRNRWSGEYLRMMWLRFLYSMVFRLFFYI
jgi:hypothetical protein